MATRYASPKIVTEGLVLYLDAGNKESYPGTGTSVTDLTQRGNNASLGAGITYATGSFNFTLNSSNELITVPHNTDFNFNYLNWSVSMWMKINFDDDGTWTQLFVKGDGLGERRPAVWFYSGQTSRFHFVWGAGGSQIVLDTSDPITTPIGVWAHWVFQARDGVMMVYKNGVKDSVTVNIADRVTNSFPFYIGGYSYRSPGIDLACFMVYTKSLSDTEILQNYNATRARFNV